MRFLSEKKICYNVPATDRSNTHMPAPQFRDLLPRCGFRTAGRMSSGQPRPHWALLGALALCLGQTVGDTHVHLDEHEEEFCTVCAIADPGPVPEIGRLDALPTGWRRSNSLPVFSATLPPRPYETGRPRAPPISVS